MDVLKQLASSEELADLYHFRASDGREVNFVLEQGNGKLLGFELKARDIASDTDSHGLKELRRQTGHDFVFEIVLYRDLKTIYFSEQLWAVPNDSI